MRVACMHCAVHAGLVACSASWSALNRSGIVAPHPLACLPSATYNTTTSIMLPSPPPPSPHCRYFFDNPMDEPDGANRLGATSFAGRVHGWNAPPLTTHPAAAARPGGEDNWVVADA